jgi:hypothetical protein
LDRKICVVVRDNCTGYEQRIDLGLSPQEVETVNQVGTKLAVATDWDLNLFTVQTRAA